MCKIVNKHFLTALRIATEMPSPLKVQDVLLDCAVGELIADITGKKENIQLTTKFKRKCIMHHTDTRLFQNDAICRGIAGEKCFVRIQVN